MNWMTVAWPMVTAACLTLALINLRIAFGDVRRAPHVFFTISALSVAAISVLELSVLREEDLVHCRWFLRMAALPVALMVTSVAGFVRSFFGTGRIWLGILGSSTLVVAESVSLLSAEPAIRNPIALRHVEGFGGISFTVPVFTSEPWSVLEMIGVLIVVALSPIERFR